MIRSRTVAVASVFVLLAAVPAGAQELYFPRDGHVVQDPRPPAGSPPHEIAIRCSSNAPVTAARQGKVAFVGSASGGHASVIVALGHGYETLYVAPGRVRARKGEHVALGATIFSGAHTKGEIVRFAVFRNGQPVALGTHVGEQILAGAAIPLAFPGLRLEGPIQRPVGKRTVVAVSFWDASSQQHVVDAAKKSKLPGRCELYLGSYGASTVLAKEAHAIGARDAPLFEVVRGHLHLRRLNAQDARRVGDTAHGGVFPVYATVLGLPWDEVFAWGREKGRRARDDIRDAVREGAVVDAWQLDELVSEVVGPRQGAIAWYVNGILTGLHAGRPELGDRPMKGLLFVAGSAFPIASARGNAVDALFATIHETCFRIAGEEYPDFVGSPSAVAARENGLKGGLAAAGGVRAALAKRYMASLTPGENLGRGLGGNVSGLPMSQVDAWRSDYIKARAHEGVAGFGEYNFRYGNADPTVMLHTLEAIAAVCR